MVLEHLSFSQLVEAAASVVEKAVVALVDLAAAVAVAESPAVAGKAAF